MTKIIVIANENDDLKKVVERLKKNSICHIPIARGKEVLGITRTSDINRLTFGSLFEG